MAPGLGGINLEDISAPRCFEIEQRLISELDIPVFHDDQHGTAVVVMAAVLNAVKLTGRNLEDLSVLIIGLGAAGIAVTRILRAAGVTRIVGADSQGRAARAARGLPGRLDEPRQALVRRGHEPRLPLRRPRRSDRRRGPADRALGRARDARRGARAHERRRDGLRDGQPDPRGAPRGGGAAREDHGHRPLGLPQPDQQRARLPGHLPRRARRARAGDHRGDEDGRRARDRLDRPARRSCATTTSSPRSSTATWRPRSPPPSASRRALAGTAEAGLEVGYAQGDTVSPGAGGPADGRV